jgi:hypothetical protein
MMAFKSIKPKLSHSAVCLPTSEDYHLSVSGKYCKRIISYFREKKKKKKNCSKITKAQNFSLVHTFSMRDR